MTKYLDYSGLWRYDELIKALIKSGNNSLIAKINEVIGGSEVDLSLSDIISLIGDIKDGETLVGLIDALEASVGANDGKITSLENKHNADITAINKNIDGIKTNHASDINIVSKEIESLRILLRDFISGSDSDNIGDITSMSELQYLIKNLQEIIGQAYAESEADTVMDRISALEYDNVYIPSVALQNNTGLSSDVHGGLGSHNAAWFAEQGYTMSDMFDMILFPTVYPELTEPSVSWSGVPSSRNVEVGSDISGYIITDDTVSSKLVFNYGSWSLDINNGKGASKGYSGISLARTNEPAVNGEGKYIIAESAVSYKATVEFESGDMSYDNKGGEYQAYPGGSKSTTTVYIRPYYNWYASTVTAGELTIQSAVANAGISQVTTGEVTLTAHTNAAPQMIKTPNMIKTYQQYNDGAGKYETIPLDTDSGWVMTSSAEEYNGVQKTFYTYTYTGSDRSNIKIKLTF